jgi:hypothetical protein
MIADMRRGEPLIFFSSFGLGVLQAAAWGIPTGAK